MLSPTERLIRYERLVAPGEQLGVLVEPPAELIRPGAPLAVAAAGQRGGFPFVELRRDLRRELGLDGPLILTGHQPEFFHAGVFAKNIAAAALARQVGGTALFLAVDTDTPKSAVVRLPQATVGGLRRVDVPIPGVDLHRPYARQPKPACDRWLGFFAQLGALHADVGDSLLGVFAKAWIDGGATSDHCDAFQRARAATEAALGLTPLRGIRESALAGTAAFRAFFTHVALHAQRFAEAYNTAQAAFRVRHKVRAKGRPVPPLRIADGRIELPFWILAPVGEEAPRLRLFVGWEGERGTFFAEDRPVFTCDRAALESGGAVAPEGWSIWPRALTLSTFARLLLADVFIHGIGGAKYDGVSEAFARSFFGVELAPMCCVTATVHLPLPHSSLTVETLRAARRASRDLRFNPQRHVARAPADLVAQRAELIRRSDELRRQHPERHDDRRVVYREIRRLNTHLLEHDPWCAARLDQRIEQIEAQLVLDRVARDREYFYPLHALERLRTLRTRIDAACHASR